MHPTCELRKTLFLASILSLSCLAATPADDQSKVIQTALQPSSLEENLRALTDEIGGRVPGTVAMQHAIDWGVQAFTAAGADSVHTGKAAPFHIPGREGAIEMTASMPRIS